MRKLYSISALKLNEARVLDKKRRRLLPCLSFLAKKKFYLAGGTALALYLGHRRSLDFDFYRKDKFNGFSLYEEVAKKFPKRTKSVLTDKMTMICEIDDIELSCFRYDYALIKKIVKYRGVNLASIEDIIAMKAITIVDRARRRDYFDLHYLLEEFGLERILASVKQKYPMFDELHVLQALTYFDEAEKDEEKDRVALFDKSLSWKKVKAEIFRQVRDYQLKMIS